MKRFKKTNGSRGINPALLLLATFALTPNADAQLGFFMEDFTGPLDTNVWSQNGDANGHTGIMDGSYFITDAHGNPGTKLVRSTGGTPGSFRNEVEVVLDPFRLDANPGTQSDFKFKMFGADGFMEIVLNSFGNMRLFHNDQTPGGGGGNIQPNTNIGNADGDLLRLVVEYDINTDQVTVTYALNGEPAVPFYSGGGIDGPIGDVITNFVEIENFKWGSDEPMEIVAGIDLWNLGDLVDVAEPTPIEITEIDYDAVEDTFRFTWRSEPEKVYALFWSNDLSDWGADVDDAISSQGESTTFPPAAGPAEPNPGTDPIEGRPEAIYFRVEER